MSEPDLVAGLRTMGKMFQAGNPCERAADVIEHLMEALYTIAGGHTDRFPGGPDIMKATSPESFRGEMWTWSQKVARAATEGEEDSGGDQG